MGTDQAGAPTESRRWCGSARSEAGINVKKHKLNCFSILAHAFVRLRCSGCRHEKLMAFSCKRCGFCPSSGATTQGGDGGLSGGSRHSYGAGTTLGAVVPDPATPVVCRRSGTADAGAGDRSSRHQPVSARTGWAIQARCRHRSGDPDSALWLGRQLEHPPALPGARWGLSAQRRRTGVRGSGSPHPRSSWRCCGNESSPR